MSKKISIHIERLRTKGQRYLEPFLGGANVMWRVGDHGTRMGADLDGRIFDLWKAILGVRSMPTAAPYVPPKISRERYYELKKVMDLSDPETLYAGFCCSNRGRWFNGYHNAKSGDAWRNIAKQIPSMKTVCLAKADYRKHKPSGMMIYCDPPYEGETPYPGLPDFDSYEFWETMHEWAKRNTVLVSESKIPESAEILETFERKGTNPLTQYLVKIRA